ncbi:MAG: hypothetical protein WDN45_17470 [Caulobacteraceae bacterium]
MLHSKFIDDCGPKALPDELCRLPVAFEADEAQARLQDGKDLAYWIDGRPSTSPPAPRPTRRCWKARSTRA